METKKKWYKSISNWIIIAICILFVPILAINLWIMIQARSNPKNIPSVFGYRPFIVLSNSMETKIHKGDLIITKVVKKKDLKKLKKKDIIAFWDAEGTVTTHRIIDIVEEDGEPHFITQGDNNNVQDKNLVSYDDVQGIYVFRIPNVGNIMNTLAQPTTIIIVVMGVTIIFIIGFMISTRKQRNLEQQEFLEYKKMKEEQEKKKTTKKSSDKKDKTKKS